MSVCIVQSNSTWISTFHVLVALGKEDRERERNEDEGTMGKGGGMGGDTCHVSFLSLCLFFVNVPEQ